MYFSYTSSLISSSSSEGLLNDQPTIFITRLVDKSWISARALLISVTSPDRGEKSSLTAFTISKAPNSWFVQFCPQFRQTTVNNISQNFLCKTADCHWSNTIFCCYPFMFFCEFPHCLQSGVPRATVGRARWVNRWCTGNRPKPEHSAPAAHSATFAGLPGNLFFFYWNTTDLGY